jgi:hypothetical protein
MRNTNKTANVLFSLKHSLTIVLVWSSSANASLKTTENVLAKLSEWTHRYIHFIEQVIARGFPGSRAGEPVTNLLLLVFSGTYFMQQVEILA